MLIRGLVCSFAIASRLRELVLSRKHMRRSGAASEGTWSRLTYPIMVLLHSAVLGGTLLRGKKPVWPFLIAFIAVQPLRLWILRTLGDSWNTRGAVPAEMTPTTSGPYKFIRHPNYAIVIVELCSLPSGFGLYRLAMVASIVNGWLLWLRIRDEETLLVRLQGYNEHFADKKRFVPFVV